MTPLEIAFHEAGHAVVAAAHGIHVERVVLEETADHVGYALFATGDDSILFEYSPVEALTSILAGFRAQQRFNPRADPAVAADDMATIHAFVRDAATVARLQALAEAHVREHWRWIERTARELTRRRTLKHSDILRLRTER